MARPGAAAAGAGGRTSCSFTVSFWLMLAVCALVAAVFGVLFGAPTLRLRGDYLAIVTLGFGEIVPIVARNAPGMTNGAHGLNGVPAPTLRLRFGVESLPVLLSGPRAWSRCVIFVSVRLQNSRIGPRLDGNSRGRDRRRGHGHQPLALKLLAFAVGAGFAGMAGTFYVAKLQTATPDMFSFPVSVMMLVMVVLGGMGSVAGVVLGALILQLLQSWFLQDLTDGSTRSAAATGIAFLEQRRARPVDRAHLRHHSGR